MDRFSKRLKELRTYKGLIYKKLAESTGLGSSTLCMYENKQRVPNMFSLIALANFFQISIDYLVGRTDF